MQFGVLANSDSWYFRDLDRAAKDAGHTALRLDFTQLAALTGAIGTALTVDGHAGSSISALIVRTMPPGSLEQVVFRMNALALWEQQGGRVVNSARSLECAIDKFLTTSRLQVASLPVPKTWVGETTTAAMAAFDELGRDIVVKPVFGSEGRGIVRVNDPDLAWRTFRAIERTDGLLYLQRYIPHAGFDTRVLVLAGKILGGMRRHSALDFRTNVSRDAQGTAYSPSDNEADMAIKAAGATGAWFAGVDLLTGPLGESYVLEVNAVPGWQAFGRVNQMDVAARFLGELVSGIRVGSE